MADPPKRRVVTAQTSTPGSSSSSTPKSQPRIRAKVDPTAISTPPTSRPTLRSTPSSSSSLSTHNHVKSPPLAPLPTRTLSSTPTPSIRVKPTPLQRASTSTPTSTAKVPSISRPSLSRPGSSASNIASPIGNFDRGRAKVKSTSTSALSTPTQPPRSSSHSRPTSRQSTLPAPPKSAAPMVQTQSQRSDSSSELTKVTSHHSSPGKQLTALPPHLRPSVGYTQHPTASCPPSLPKNDTPLVVPVYGHGAGHVQGRGNRSSPIHPNTHFKESKVDTPSSPEMRTVELPTMTPRGSFDFSERDGSMSRQGSRQGIDPRSINSASGEGFRDRWSGSTAVEYDTGAGDLLDKINGLEIDQGVEAQSFQAKKESTRENGADGGLTESQILDEDAEDAKINRKIADLEISNGSLMAINRSLEAAKAKQRGEIIKLRRALRESTDGHTHAGPSFRPLLSPSFTSTSPTPNDVDEVDTASDLEVEMDDPELEDRWDKLQELVLAMQKQADKAVVTSVEEYKVGTKVLDWVEVDDSVEMGDVSTDLALADTRDGTPED